MYLGKLRIEYKKNNNVVQIYNSPKACSLVINDKVVDQYNGAVSDGFILKYFFEKDGKFVTIEAKMGQLFMRLYYNGVLVAKKFMAFG